MAVAHVSNGIMAVVLIAIRKRPFLELLWPEKQQLLQSCPALLISAQEPGAWTRTDAHT